MFRCYVLALTPLKILRHGPVLKVEFVVVRFAALRLCFRYELLWASRVEGWRFPRPPELAFIVALRAH